MIVMTMLFGKADRAVATMRVYAQTEQGQLGLPMTTSTTMPQGGQLLGMTMFMIENPTALDEAGLIQ